MKLIERKRRKIDKLEERMKVGRVNELKKKKKWNMKYEKKRGK